MSSPHISSANPQGPHIIHIQKASSAKMRTMDITFLNVIPDSLTPIRISSFSSNLLGN